MSDRVRWPERTASRPGLLIAWCLVVLVLLTACEVRAELNIAVEADGTGTVEFAVALDDEAATRGAELLAELAIDDLVVAGWDIAGPAAEDDGYTWIRAAHHFGTPGELGDLVDEIAGPGGPFRDFSLERKNSFASSEFRFSGTVDFTGGIDDLAADAELAEVLDAEPIDLLDAHIGGIVDDLLSVRIAIRLPGDVGSNALTQASNGAVWEPSVTEPETIGLWATGTVRRTERLVYAGVAAVAAVALVLFGAIRVVLWRRSRRS